MWGPEGAPSSSGGSRDSRRAADLILILPILGCNHRERGRENKTRGKMSDFVRHFRHFYHVTLPSKGPRKPKADHSNGFVLQKPVYRQNSVANDAKRRNKDVPKSDTYRGQTLLSLSFSVIFRNMTEVQSRTHWLHLGDRLPATGRHSLPLSFGSPNTRGTYYKCNV